ncbi:MAG: PKD domain-containing protein, partial [Bacteroidia bacterium]
QLEMDIAGHLLTANRQHLQQPLRSHVLMEPVITASATPVCVGSSGILMATGANTYTWSPTTYLNPSVGSNVSIAPTNTTTILYTVIGQDGNGCASSTSINVQPTALPIVSLLPSIVKGCAPQCVTYSVTSNNAAATGNGYSWTFANGQPATSTAASPQPCFNGAGNNAVMLTFTDINGCVNTATASVLTYPLPVADFDYFPKPISILTPDVHFNNETYTTGGAATYYWNFGDSLTLADTSNQTNPLYTYANSGIYNITLITTSPNGCKDTAVKTIVVDEDFAIYVPNAFTPNGDGKNETFKAEADGISNFTMYVFDRWGNNIFTTHDINTGWDGRRNNRGGSEILQQDVYVWKIQVSTIKHQGKSYTGTVTLLK